ncbi:hypothetical protein GCM10011515_11200 [Tsuneonella deserti]|uniref:Uncharacterized protein n=2 Tax=Tsuneonella deserti TaxID=2035528 RepID=A0ABQ1S781_9SPHN|nr:hypothetical protein GCM10011515_11200 [Tsuneonella deserti]
MAAVAALSACSQKADEAPAATDTTMAEAEPAAGVTTGTYDVKMADGTMAKTVINADGTYVDTDKDGKETRGAYVRKDGKDCFDPEGADPEVCWSVTAPGADGGFTATMPDGKTTVTVTPASVTTTVTTAATPTATATTAAATPAPTAT